MYTTTEVRQIFSTSRQTVSNWCRDFGAYLSPTATPEEGSHRKFTDADMTVFALVADMRAQGGTSEMIHAALRMGQRGGVNTDLALVPIAQQSMALQARVRQLEGDVDAMRLEAARNLLLDAQASIATVARLTGFGHPENLRRSFQKHLSVSPRDFYQRFG